MNKGSSKCVANKNALNLRLVNATCCANTGMLYFVMMMTLFVPLVSAGDQVYVFDIPQQRADGALTVLATQADISIVFDYDAISQHQTNSLKGVYVIRKAVELLLAGTELMYAFNDRGHLIITEKKDLYEDLKMGIKRKRQTLAGVLSFFLYSGGAQIVVAEESGWLLEEVVVTASKRGAGESVNDSSMAISALSSESIDKRGLVGMDDYLRTLPGISMQDRGPGQNSVIIRGLSLDPQASRGSTGVYFGETPLTGLGSASAAGSSGNGDIKLVDIERAEVLRGPQGTLYGADALGGIVRVLPVAPNLQQVEGKLATRYSHTGEDGGDNTMVQGVLNIPLIEDTLAVRGVVYHFDNSGFINNVADSQPIAGIDEFRAFGGVAADRGDVGNNQYKGFRLSTLWRPSDELDATLTYLKQKIEQDGLSEIELNLAGDYQQRRHNTGISGSSYELIENEIEITNLLVNYDLNWGVITSSSSWVDYDGKIEEDKVALVNVFSAIFPSRVAPNQPSYFDSKNKVENFIQELRLASQLDGPLQFVAGLYYEDRERAADIRQTWSGDPAQQPADLQTNVNSGDTTQKAFFGELSYDISEKWKGTLGGRYFDYERNGVLQTSFLGGVRPEELTATEETGQTYKAGLSYTPNEDTLLYGQWSQGFRLGSDAPDSNVNCDIQSIPSPDRLDSDTTDNYEIGFKASLADNRIQFNSAVYRIDWENIPVVTSHPNNCFVRENAGKAKSEGIELELQARLTESLEVAVSASYGEATLVGDSNIGNDGDNLPGSSDFNATVGIQYDFILASYDSFARADYTYISEYFSSVDETGSAVTPEPAGGFGQLNVKVGLEMDKVAVDLFVNNLTNNDGLTWLETISSGTPESGSRAYTIRPRTVGLNLRYSF